MDGLTRLPPGWNDGCGTTEAVGTRRDDYAFYCTDRRCIRKGNNIDAILWGGGNTTNVIKNFSNTDDHCWLAAKLIKYFASPTPVVKH